jgi:hypothetical protein
VNAFGGVRMRKGSPLLEISITDKIMAKLLIVLCASSLIIWRCKGKKTCLLINARKL